jgi:hypothetical protein
MSHRDKDHSRAVHVDGFTFYRKSPWVEGVWMIYAWIGGEWRIYASTDKGEDDAKRLTRKMGNRLRRAAERRAKEAALEADVRREL